MDYQQAAGLLREKDNILIVTHRLPDGDTIGCGVGLCRMLRSIGKTAWLLANSDTSGLFTPYMAGLIAPEGYTPSYIVTVDIADPSLFPREMAPYAARGVDISFDHHISHAGFGRENCVDAARAACGELIYDVCRTLGAVTADVASPLYVAVATDTGCFQYGNTTPETHHVAAALMETGIDFKTLNKRHFRTKSLRRLKIESSLVDGMDCRDDGRTAVATISLAMLTDIGATQEDLEDISAFIGQAEGVTVSITLREMKPDEWKISVRTANGLSASEACALLGGGGHHAAAGCTVIGTAQEAKDAILGAIAEVRAHG
ncbi:MAG: DHH family phosphoesterase [Oscillospiraceae bacterium]|nr:DHH family phosphoesterase [Oscillospiraceae bacterium]